MIDLTPVKNSKQRIAGWAISWLVITVTAYFSTMPVAPLPTKAVLMIQSSSLIGLGFLFYPGWDSLKIEKAPIWMWGLGLAMATFIIAELDNFATIPASKIALAVFLLSVFLLSLAFATQASRVNSRLLSWLILWSASLLSTLPLWMSPWIEVISSTQAKLQFLLWSSPLSYLATMLDYDYLRSDWFYQHTPYGMYRYNYPDPVWSSASLIGACSILMMIIKARPDSERKIS